MILMLQIRNLGESGLGMITFISVKSNLNMGETIIKLSFGQPYSSLTKLLNHKIKYYYIFIYNYTI